MGRQSAISEWGPAAWKFMHVVSFTYPNAPSEKDRRDAFEFMHSLAKMLPCKRCREEWVMYLKENLASVDSHHLQSKLAFSRFLVSGHNFVNTRLGKKTYTYVEAQAMFDPSATHVPAFSTCRVTAIVTVVLLALALSYIYASHRQRRGTSRISPGFRESSPLKMEGFRT